MPNGNGQLCFKFVVNFYIKYIEKMSNMVACNKTANVTRTFLGGTKNVSYSNVQLYQYNEKMRGTNLVNYNKVGTQWTVGMFMGNKTL